MHRVLSVALITEEGRFLVLQELLLDGEEVVVMVVVVRVLVPRRRLGMRVVAVSPGSCMQAPWFRVTTAVVEKRRRS